MATHSLLHSQLHSMFKVRISKFTRLVIHKSTGVNCNLARSNPQSRLTRNPAALQSRGKLTQPSYRAVHLEKAEDRLLFLESRPIWPPSALGAQLPKFGFNLCP
ncbi:hypothetical protein B9Z19DRAFT_1063489 [Tuber borchii]|uniref:Uncharacterized protein n=1 Tax=Tuber borchii TaxID=42251 RepID=A0A2T6ZY32_TUBBO|nr:hypothetical protein B9Z19DRAFT_1063489 [Tuber borchii]